MKPGQFHPRWTTAESPARTLLGEDHRNHHRCRDEQAYHHAPDPIGKFAATTIPAALFLHGQRSRCPLAQFLNHLGKIVIMRFFARHFVSLRLPSRPSAGACGSIGEVCYGQMSARSQTGQAGSGRVFSLTLDFSAATPLFRKRAVGTAAPPYLSDSWVGLGRENTAPSEHGIIETPP